MTIKNMKMFFISIIFFAFPVFGGNLPPYILPPDEPEDNPFTEEKAILGKMLYFDVRLSSDNSVSCATCHNPALGFADGEKTGVGVRGQKGNRNSPTTLNAAFYELQFWDGRALTLEEQAKGPIINPIEMAMESHKALEKKLRKIPEYKKEFKKVFNTKKLTIDHIAHAIAAFERTLVTVSSPFDKFVAGDEKAISEKAKKGWKLFNGKARCSTCHGFVEVYPFFTDNKFKNIGVSMHIENFEELARKAQRGESLDSEKNLSELGRFLVTKNPKDIGAFKTSGLRNIALTAPYMHDGTLKTLKDVVDFYDKGGISNPNLDGGIFPLNLTDMEKNQLVEFMKTLTSDDLDELM